MIAFNLPICVAQFPRLIIMHVCFSTSEQQRLLHLVHESDDGTYYTGNDPVDIPIMWRYRVRVDLGHVTRTLTEQQATGGAIEPDKYPILHYFLEKVIIFM